MQLKDCESKVFLIKYLVSHHIWCWLHTKVIIFPTLKWFAANIFMSQKCYLYLIFELFFFYELILFFFFSPFFFFTCSLLVWNKYTVLIVALRTFYLVFSNSSIMRNWMILWTTHNLLLSHSFVLVTKEGKGFSLKS